jgi:hypothetical protein
MNLPSPFAPTLDSLPSQGITIGAMLLDSGLLGKNDESMKLLRLPTDVGMHSQ